MFDCQHQFNPKLNPNYETKKTSHVLHTKERSVRSVTNIRSCSRTGTFELKILTGTNDSRTVEGKKTNNTSVLERGNAFT